MFKFFVVSFVAFPAMAYAGSGDRVTPRDVDFFIANPSLAETTLRVCHSNSAYSVLAECRNAEAAATQRMGDQYGRRGMIRTSNNLNSPEYWSQNPMMRQQVIDSCSSGQRITEVTSRYCKVAGISRLTEARR